MKSKVAVAFAALSSLLAVRPGATAPDVVPSPPPPAFSRGVEIASLDAEPIHSEEVVLVKDRLTSGRDRVAVDVYRPPSSGPHPAVVVLHGTHGPGRAEKYYLKLTESLARHGYIGLFVRYYDRGRKGKGNRAQWAQTIGDTLSFAATLPGADPERMALVGYSQGAFLALNDAPTDRRIRAVVAYYGGLSPGFFPSAQEDMPPTLLFHGTADRTVPVRRSIETLKVLRDAGHPADLVVYPGAVHGFNLNALPGPDAFAAEDSWERTLEFLDFHLRYPAWTPAVTPVAGAPTQRADASAEDSTADPAAGTSAAPQSVPYLAPVQPQDPEVRPPLIDPTLEQMDQILRTAPPPKGHGKRSLGHGSGHGKKGGKTSTKPAPQPAEPAIMP
jgi:carboxymethylenebutenolidase